MKRGPEDKTYITVSLASNSLEEKQKMNHQIDLVAEKYDSNWIGQGTFVRSDDSQDPEEPEFIHDIGYDVPLHNVERFIQEISALNPKFEVSRG